MPELLHLAGDDRFPNSALPVLLYREALPPDPAVMEQGFARRGWSNSWRDGIFRYHHFHSIAHEVLGVAAGHVAVRFGGPNGQDAALQQGDVVVIPAGVAHCNRGHSADLLVVGAYPGGADYDVRRGDPAELAAACQAIAAVPLPEQGPVPGGDAIQQLWRA